MRFLYLGEILLSIPYVYKEKSLKFPKVTLRSLSSLRPVVLLQAKNTESLPEYFAFRSRKFFLSVTDSRNVFLCSRLAIWSLLGFGSSHGQQGTWFITQLVTGPYFLFPSYHFISRSRRGRPKKRERVSCWRKGNVPFCNGIYEIMQIYFLSILMD